MYRMPTHFGPSAGPRSNSDGKRFDWRDMEAVTVGLTLESNAEKIEAVLPVGFERLGEPKVSVAFTYFRNLPWLAGRGYNVFGVRTPVQYCDAVGDLLLVLWENLADPIITGREELGVNKIYCELPDLRRSGDRVWCTASWLGFPFCSLEVRDIKEAEAPPPDPLTKGQLLHHKYFPKTQNWGGADVDQVTLTPELKGGTLLSSEIGECRLTWGRPQWEDMPTQHHIVDGLRNIASGRILSSAITHTRGFVSDHYDQQVVRRDD